MVSNDANELMELIEHWEGYDSNLSPSENLIELQMALGTYQESDEFLELLKKLF